LSIDIEKVKKLFLPGKSIIWVAADIFHFCLDNQERTERVKSIKEASNLNVYSEQFQSFLAEWLSPFPKNDVRLLSEVHVNEIHQFIDQWVPPGGEILIFAELFAITFDDLFGYLASQYLENRHENIPIFETESGYFLPKHEEAGLFTRIKRKKEDIYTMPRKRKEYFKNKFPVKLNHFHFIPKKVGSYFVEIQNLPHFLMTEWGTWIQKNGNFSIVLSSITTEYEITHFEGVDEYGQRFVIPKAKNPDQHFERICKEVKAAFDDFIPILIIPELTLDPDYETDFLSFLDGILYEYEHGMVIIVGYLHTRQQDGLYRNIAKVFVPVFDNREQSFSYKVLLEEVKRNKVFTDPPFEGSEWFVPGDTYQLVETPFGRFMVSICKDFLELQTNTMERFELDFLFVSAMTPRMDGKFQDRADFFCSNHNLMSVIANNGHHADHPQNTREEEENYCYAVAPILRKSTGSMTKETVHQKYKRKKGQTETLEYFHL